MGAAANPPPPSVAVRAILRAPDGQPLLDDGTGYRSPTGDRYPVQDGILWLLPRAARGADQGDDDFYDAYPFGERNWADPADVEAGVERELRQLLQPLPASALILDVGAGAGRLSIYLGMRGYTNTVSLDRSLISMHQVRAHSPNVCVWGDALRLPFSDGAFDLVICSGVAHHTPAPHAAIEECIRVLTPGGRLYLRVYNRRSPYRYVHATYGALLRRLDRRHGGRGWGERIGFRAYTWIRRVVLRRPPAAPRQLRAKFGNLFLKPLVYFFATGELAELLARHGLVVESCAQLGFTHRMHHYVARKPA